MGKIKITLLFLVASLTSFSQTSTGLRDSIVNLLVGDWYWVDSSGSHSNGFGGPKETGYTSLVHLERSGQDDSIRFYTYKNDFLVKTGKTYLKEDTRAENTWKVGEILIDEHSGEVFNPYDDEPYINLRLLNNDSILFFNLMIADSYSLLYSKTPCKNCYPRKLVNRANGWTVASETFDGEKYLPPQSAYLKFDSYSANLNDTLYLPLYISYNYTRTAYQLHSYWREEKSGKIFRKLPGHKEELMYDFSKKTGDTIVYSETERQVVIDSILIKPFGKTDRKFLYAHLIFEPSHEITWIEGVGSFFGPNINDDYFLVGGKYTLTCFEEDGIIIYHNSDFPDCFITSSVESKKIIKKIKFYPNPLTDILTIEQSQVLQDELTLEIFTLKGELIRKECIESSSNPIQVNLSSLKAGSYFLRLSTGSELFEEKVIIKK